MPPAVGPRLTKSIAEGRSDLLPFCVLLFPVPMFCPVVPSAEVLLLLFACGARKDVGRPIVVVRLFCCDARTSFAWSPRSTGVNEGIRDLLPWCPAAGYSCVVSAICSPNLGTFLGGSSSKECCGMCESAKGPIIPAPA